jgi:hypothetical protein
MPPHTCHALGCTKRCPPKHLMCGACWALVPPDIAREVYRTVKLRTPEINATWAPWWRAQARAVDAVARQSLQAGERLDAELARQLAFADKLEAR